MRHRRALFQNICGGSFTPTAGFYRRGSKSKLRKLTNLLDDENIFKDLHEKFCIILKGTTNRLLEKRFIKSFDQTSKILSYSVMNSQLQEQKQLDKQENAQVFHFL